jgi:glutaredoxin 3
LGRCIAASLQQTTAAFSFVFLSSLTAYKKPAPLPPLPPHLISSSLVFSFPEASSLWNTSFTPTISFFRRLFHGSPSAEAMSTAKVNAQKFIDENPVAVFSKSYCPYCKATKSLLTEMNANFAVIELDQVDDGSDIQAALKEISGQGTVPNIYIGKQHIGGNSDLQSKKKQLPELLRSANAL